MSSTTAEERERCAEVSVRRGEPLQATASRVRRWMVIEQPGAWGRDALSESRLDPDVARTLNEHGKRHRTRIILARRPGWRGDVETRQVFLASTHPSGGWIERLELADDELCDVDLGALRSERPPGLGRPGPNPLLLVCTNGRHDPCCADLGRPVARALAAAGVPDVWECSHIGGDRFAANVVALPTGVYLGRVPPDAAPAMMRELADGHVDLEHYRGRSCYPTLVQAAEVAVRRAIDEAGLLAVQVEAVTEIAEHDVVVRFRHGDSRIDARVRRRRSSSAARLTCHGGSGRPWEYELVDLDGPHPR